MKWRTVLLLLVPAILLVMITVAGVACLVPVRFSVTARGRVEPERRIIVTAARNGLLTYVRDPGPVNEGDVLFRQSMNTENRRVRFIQRRLDLLQQLLDEEEKRLEREKRRHEIDLAEAEGERARTEHKMKRLRTRIHPLEERLQKLAVEEKQEREALARKELEILEKLAKEQSVPLQEVARGRTAAAVARIQRESAEATAEHERLRREQTLADLEADLAAAVARVKRLRLQEPDRTAWFQVRRQIETLSEELADVREDIRAKEIRAPWSGQWQARQAFAGEYAAQGRRVGILTDPSRLRFTGFVRESQARWLRPGLKARLRIQAYPYLRYGRIPARLAHFEPAAAGAGATVAGTPPIAQAPATQGVYRVQLTVETGPEAPFRVLPGMVGRADIMVFRGTLLQYILAEPGVRGRRGRKPRLLELLKRSG